jgi:hypothetical protein
MADEFPLSLSKFAETVRTTVDEIWIGVLKQRYLHSKMTESQWKATIEKIKSEPAT